jgi:hypothetical protein
MFLMMVKNFIKWISIIFVAGVIIIFLFGKQIMIFLWHDLPFMGENFNQKVWLTALQCNTGRECIDEELACIRGSMYRDLARNYLFTGTPKNKVGELLGESQKAYQHPECIDYPLGFCSGLQIDTDFLRVCFDDKNTIQSVFHYQS